MIVIAHRMSTLKMADHVIVLAEGGVRERGLVDEVLWNKALFGRVYELQSLEEVSETEGAGQSSSPRQA